jgi:hypothetical protein
VKGAKGEKCMKGRKTGTGGRKFATMWPGDKTDPSAAAATRPSVGMTGKKQGAGERVSGKIPMPGMRKNPTGSNSG